MNAICPTPWIGTPQGYLSDWITQRWVQLTGHYVDLEQEVWLRGPTGKATGIGLNYFDELAQETGLTIHKNRAGSGLVSNFNQLSSPDFEAGQVHPAVVDFYEHTSDYELDMWGEWSNLFRPFGALLAYIFSRRLQQLNVPLSSLDTSKGVSSDIIQLVNPVSGEIKYTAWVRQLIGTGDVLYVGSYSLCRVPNHIGNCVKVVFPLPNGSAVVITKPILHSDGSFSVVSSGERFGDPGLYFLVRNPNGRISARYLRALRERIHVYADQKGIVRADHVFWLFGIMFMRLHYRLRKK